MRVKPQAQHHPRTPQTALSPASTPLLFAIICPLVDADAGRTNRMRKIVFRYSLGGVCVLALAGLAIVSLYPTDSASSYKRLEYQWSPAEQAQRDLAIERRDTSLLPKCTDDYFRWREETRPAREAAGDAPFSMDFWSAPGCRGEPDRVIRGPGGSTSQPDLK